jgi:hypothetical protein
MLIYRKNKLKVTLRPVAYYHFRKVLFTQEVIYDLFRALSSYNPFRIGTMSIYGV